MRIDGGEKLDTFLAGVSGRNKQRTKNVVEATAPFSKKENNKNIPVPETVTIRRDLCGIGAQ